MLITIGTNIELTYLINRFAERSGAPLVTTPTVSPSDAVSLNEADALLFTSIEALESAQKVVPAVQNQDIPVLVCTSLADESHARDLGADYCLLHPLTYERFVSALSFVDSMKHKKKK